MKQFGYGAIVVSFLLKRVPLMRPRVPLSRLDSEDPRMTRWVEAITHHGGGGHPRVTYGTVFFRWLRGQLLMVEDYSYAGEDFRDDPDLPLPEGDQWDDRGKKHITIHVFCFLYYI